MFRYFSCLCLLFTLTACPAQPKQTQGSSMDANYTDLERLPPSFDPKRTDFPCATWTEPAPPDEASERWYKAASTIAAKKYRRSVKEYQQMQVLYEAAARKGHYKAIKDLIILYNSSDYAWGDEFSAQPDKARYWLHYGLNQGWAGAYDWLSTALHYGYAGYPVNEKLSLAYLQKASDLGVPFSQYSLALIYGSTYDKSEVKDALLRCAAKQDFSPALEDLATYTEIDEKPAEALELHHRAVMNGGAKGGEAAMVLAGAFAGKQQFQQDLKTEIDEERSKAYKEIKEALNGTSSTSGNIYLRFPRLNEVLPLPPAQMPPWQGIYSAMSKEDAHYYQNLPNIDDLIKEVKAAGLLVPVDYITKPLPPKPVEPYDNDAEDSEVF